MQNIKVGGENLSLIGNRYEILNFDGNIELNKIYEARDAYDNIKVLIKVIEHNNNICSDFISNLIDENTMINQLNSPYILKTIDTVSYTHLTLPTNVSMCRSRWSPYH